MIYFSALPESGGNDETVRVAVFFHLLPSNHDHVYSLTHPVKVPVYISHYTTPIEFTSLDDQKVHVAIWPHCPARGRAEENDPLRACHLNDPPDDLIQNLLSYLFLLHREIPVAKTPSINGSSAFLLFSSSLAVKTIGATGSPFLRSRISRLTVAMR